MSRHRPPARRRNETVDLEFAGTSYAVTIGLFPDGQVGEVFAHGAKVGSAMDAILDDACVMVSLLLQRARNADAGGSIGSALVWLEIAAAIRAARRGGAVHHPDAECQTESAEP